MKLFMFILFPGSEESFPDILQCIVQGLLYCMFPPLFFGWVGGFASNTSPLKMMVNPAVFG